MKALNLKAPGRSVREKNSHNGTRVDYLDTAASVVMKLMLIVALFCPISTTMEGSKHPQYYQEFLLVNAVAVLFLIFMESRPSGRSGGTGRIWSSASSFCL